MIFASLWDLNISPFLGLVLGGLVVLLGIASIYMGVTMSLKLDKVRQAAIKRASQQGGASDLCAPSGLTMVQFREMANTLNGTQFSDEELHYIAGALSFTVNADMRVTKE